MIEICILNKKQRFFEIRHYQKVLQDISELLHQNQNGWSSVSGEGESREDGGAQYPPPPPRSFTAY